MCGHWCYWWCFVESGWGIWVMVLTSQGVGVAMAGYSIMGMTNCIDSSMDLVAVCVMVWVGCKCL
jgi:hypothetical protein